MLQIKSKSDIKRLPVGTKLILVNSLIGECYQPRTVKAVKSNHLIMSTADNKDSYLYLDTPNETVLPTEKGFKITGFDKLNQKHYLGVEYILA